MGIRSKIITITAGIMVLSMAVSILISSYMFKTAYTESLQSRATVVAKTLSLQLDRLFRLGLGIESIIGFDEQCKEAQEEYENINHAMVVNPDGMVLFHGGCSKRGAYMPDAALLGAIKAKTEKTVFVKKHGAGDYFTVAPVFDSNGRHAASVITGFHADLAAIKARSMASYSAMAGLVFMAAAVLLLIMALSSQITRPLTKLLNAVENIRESGAARAARVDIRSKDEIGRLAAKFNMMTDELRLTTVSRNDLMAANENLKREISERLLAEAGLAESEARFRLIFEDGPVGMLIMGENHRIIRANKAMGKMLGYSENELIGMTFDDITYFEDREKSNELAQKLFSGDGGKYTMVKRYIKKDGGIIWANLQASLFKGRDGELFGLGMAEDITDKLQSENRIRMLAYYDGLTGLPNRVFFKELIDRSLVYADRYKTMIAVLFLDLDNFKRVNDTLGHEAGDRLLKEASSRIQKAIRKSDQMARYSDASLEGGDGEDVVSRLGGDEFVVMLHNITDAQQAGRVAKRILNGLSGLFDLGGREVFVTASAGISIYPSDASDAESLLKNADTAMYHAKSTGKNNWQFFSKSMNDRAVENLIMEGRLHRAMENGEFIVHYQPLIDARTMEVTGSEALVRWSDPGGGMRQPASFIPLAEESGLIVPIGEFVLNAACARQRQWHDAGHWKLYVSVNLSCRQFENSDIVAAVSKALKDSGLPPRSLTLEITESAVMRRPSEAIKALNALKNLGVRISLDDFGTGYSSLNYLRNVPIDYLKIDRSFVSNATTSPKDASIVKAIISLAHSMGFRVVAEGVENREQAAIVIGYGCDEMQGYLFSRPLPADEAEKCFGPGFAGLKI